GGGRGARVAAPLGGCWGRALALWPRGRPTTAHPPQTRVETWPPARPNRRSALHPTASATCKLQAAKLVTPGFSPQLARERAKPCRSMPHKPLARVLLRALILERVSRRRPMSRRAGFSLTELMVTVLVMRILAAFSAPAVFKAISRWNLHTSRQLVISEVKLLREKAVTQGRPLRIWFSPGSNLYWFLNPKTNVWVSYQLPSRVTFYSVAFPG